MITEQKRRTGESGNQRQTIRKRSEEPGSQGQINGKRRESGNKERRKKQKDPGKPGIRDRKAERGLDSQELKE